MDFLQYLCFKVCNW